MLKLRSSAARFEQGTNASTVIVAAAEAVFGGSIHGTSLSSVVQSSSKVGLPWCGKRVAWLTIDSKVPFPRGFSHAYLVGHEDVVPVMVVSVAVVVVVVAAVVIGLQGTRGRPKP